jgi:hypothetical protein
MDVYPAVSGMAQVLLRVRPGACYVAGLWAGGSFVEDLLWHVELPPAGHGIGSTGTDEKSGGGWEWKDRPAQWRAPSWSWAAVEAPVEFLNGEEGIEASCEVVEVACEAVGPDPMGELQEGGSYLVVKGQLVPAKLRFKEGEDPKPWNLIDLDILDGGHLKNLWADDDCRSLVPAEDEQTTVYCLLIGRKLPRRELLCLVLAQMPLDYSIRGQDRGLQEGQDRGLQEDQHLYRRIGMVEIFGGPPSPVLWGWVHNLLGKGEDKVIRII